jgi:predicted aspartyl protease
MQVNSPGTRPRHEFRTRIWRIDGLLGPPLLPASSNELLPFEALIDTGSSDVVFPDAFMQRLGLMRIDSTIVGTAGHEARAYRYVGQILLPDLGFTAEMSVLGVKGIPVDRPALLGRSALALFDFEFRRASAELTLIYEP